MIIFAISFLSTLQVFSQTKIEIIDGVYKENDLYYMFIEPKQKKERWYKLFV